MYLISVAFRFFSHFTYLHLITVVCLLKYQVFQIRILAIFDIIFKICDNFCQIWAKKAHAN